jgi:DNA-binding LacI/PurR family transcriptional regulator
LDRLPEDWQGIVGGEGRIETVFCEGNGPGAREAFRGAWESGRGSPDRPTCALAASEPIALGVARACRDLRLGIPGGLGLASLERSPLGGLWPTALTGLGVDPVGFADRCANLLLSRMSGRDEEGPKALRFEAELFLGETLAVAPGRG